jgi:nicotinamide mononucleotide adenylyltransferase
MINSFSQFLVEEEKAVYFTFGRMNPPTIGHGKLLDKLASKAGKNPYRVYLSQSSDAKKNPLAYADKVKFVRKMFPKHARSVMLNKGVKTAIDAAVALYNVKQRL